MAHQHSRYRFHNEALLKAGLYDQCPLVTLNYYDALNAVHVDEYEEHVDGMWENTVNVPSPDMQTPNNLSRAFLGFDPASIITKEDEAYGKKKPDKSDTKKRKRKGLFARKEELEGQIRTFKIQMLPTKEQKEELKRCFKLKRMAFNFTNQRIRKHKAAVNFIDLRKQWFDQPIPEWASEPNTRVAHLIQAYGVKQCTDAYVSNFAKQKKNPHHQFVIRDQHVDENVTEVIVIEKDHPSQSKYGDIPDRKRFGAIPDEQKQDGRRDECLLHLGNNLKTAGGIRLRDSRKVIAMLLAEATQLKENAKIQWNKRLGRFHFIYAYVQPKLEDPDPEFLRKRIVATDPGITPFQEWYSPTTGEYGRLLEIGAAGMKERFERVDRLQQKITERESKFIEHKVGLTRPHLNRREQCKRFNRKTSRMRKRLWRIHGHMHNWMENGHYAAANFLLRRHDIIIQPILSTMELAKNGKSNLNAVNKRKMLTWSHFMFRQRLKSAAARYPGRHVFETREPGTSKTCTHCGTWKANLSGMVYKCNACKVVVDRQFAGARNNFFAAYGMAEDIGWDGVDA